MCRIILTWLAILSSFCPIYAIRELPKISTRNGHILIQVDRNKNIELLVSGTGHLIVNGDDIISLINSVKNVSNLIESLKRPAAPSSTNSDENNSIIAPNFFQRVDNIEQGFINHTAKSRLDFMRIRRRLNIMQRNVRNMMQSLATNECNSNPCANGGTCQDLYKSFTCTCPQGWEGTECDRDVNECARFAGTDLGCQNGATCTNKLGSYECTCPIGFFGMHCTRKAVDCYAAGRELCGHGSCISQATGYKCVCDQGWTTDGKNPACTVDVNECESKQLPCSTNPLVQCINVPGSFYCGHCPLGYSGNGYYCNDIDECEVFNGGCSMTPLVQCINTPGSRTCGLCPPSFVGNGITCSYQASVCGVNNGGCHPLAQCRDNPRISSSYVECVCPRGYIGNGFGPSGCVQSSTTLDPCNPNPCVFGTCSISNLTNDYLCFCRLKYTGRNCDIKKDACLSNPCQNGGTCIDILGLSYRCKCPFQFVGNNCQTEKQSCGGKLESFDGVLQFPLNPNQKYNHALSCAWVIQTNSTKVLNITFTKFDLEDSTECQYDWIQIHDGKNSAAHNIGRFCGSKLPKGGNIITTTNLVYIWFRSDTKLSKDGFALNWTTIDPVCGGTITASSYGTIQSPGYPGNYPLNRDCYWKITADRKNRIEFHFFTLMIGQDVNCTGDYLEFYYDIAKLDNRFAQYCSTTHPAPLTSQSHKVVIYFHSNDKLTYSGFQISYKVVSGIPSCGGTFTTRTGQITSPVVSFSSLETEYLECEYKISVENQLRIKSEFMTLNLFKYGSYCPEYINVYDGPTNESPLMMKLCGSNIPKAFLSMGNEILIVYKGSRPNTFSLKYEAVCGRKYSASTGVISSANYPLLTESLGECLYEIQQPPGNYISLTISDFTTSILLFASPTIEVKDGNSREAKLLGRYQPSSSFPVTISSTHNYMTVIVARMNWYFSKRKYYMNYTTEDAGCGGIYTDDLGTIKSPNHPGIYSNEANCRWMIQAPPNYVVQLTFLNFKLEQSHSCSYDYVAIYDINDKSENEGLIGTFCGSKIPPTLLSASNTMRVVFKTDSSHTSDGFLATYVFISEENVCGGTYFTSAGVIKSPKYPNPYPVNRDCKWIIHVQHNRQIMLNVTDFQLESYSKCRYDFLEIRNGGTGASPVIGRYCGTDIPKLIPSHANQLFIHFKTDMTRNARGFKITWSSASTGCGGLLTSPKGSIISPHYPEPYSRNTECYWKISINAGSIIQIVFADLELEPHLICYLDYVEVFDGKDLSAKSLGRFCTHHPPYLRSTSNHMMIKFRSDLSFQGRGFQIQYSTVCENSISGYSGVIESPNFPNIYPQNEDCTWTVGVSPGNKINITFSHFELERSMTYSTEKCNFDYVEFIYNDRDTEQEVKKIYCGDEILPVITINSNTTKIHFVSDHLLMGNGFRLEWQLVGCGGIFTHPTGTFQSPNYPNHYPPSTTCDWIIQVPYGNSIAVSFDKLDIEPTVSCSYDMIQIYNGPDDKSELMNELCHTNKPITVTGSGSSMLIRFQSDSSYEGTGFEGSYKMVPSKCGGTLRVNAGQFTSPNYPKNYDAGITCEWLIEIENNHVIELTFNDVDLVQFGNKTYVKVYNGPSSAYPLLAYLSGDRTPNETIRSTYNQLFVEMVTSNFKTLTAKGFKASYVTACGAYLDSETSGVIDYNPVQSLYMDSCQWTIFAPELSEHVSLVLSQVRGYYCDFEIHWISIYDGFNNTAPLIGTYCETLPHMITSTGYVLHIESNMGFKASYSTLDTACGGSLEGDHGYFATPNFPNNYPVNMECEWIVNISDTMTTSLTFETFELIDSEHCNDDFLEIRENGNDGNLLGVFCGNNAPVNISSIGRIWIYFKSSKPDDGELATTAKGFKAEYVLVKHTDLNKPSGIIQSPLYPDFYSKSDVFTWRITVKFGYRIAINIKELIMSYDNDDLCYGAIVSFYDGYDTSAPLLYELCSMTVKSFKSTSNVMFIEASAAITRRGVKFAWEWLQVEDIKNTTIQQNDACGTKEVINIQSMRNYTLKSPGYPDGYDHSLDCEWIFSTIPQNHLQIDFYLVDLDYRTPCLFDRVEVYSGRNGVEDWQLLNTVCLPNDTFRETIDSSNLMKVAFKTDSYLNQTGFNAMITEACGGSVEKSNGIISVTNSTFSNLYSLDCQWNISVRSGRTMKVRFQWFDLGKNVDLKCNNYILLKNGNSASSPILGDGKYCGENTPPILQTTSNHLYVKFSTRTRVRGFSMKYDEISVNCDSKISLSDMDNVTTISSPNYPNIPLPHTECKWLINAIPGESIQIDFVERFDLTDTSDCEKEYVEIRDGGTSMSPLVGRFCESMPSTIVTRDNMAFVKFFTDVEEPRNGFKIKASIAKCGGTIRDTTGEIQSRYFNHKKRYSIKENCSWEIEGPAGHFIIINFETLDLSVYGETCQTEYVEILEHSIVDYNNLTSIGKYCKTKPDEIRTTSNKIRVRYASTDRSVLIIGFQLKFKTSKEKCGGVVENDFGFITSPRYPVMFPTRCEWTIKVTKGRRIRVEILDLDFDTTQPSQGLAFSNAEDFAAHITFVKPNDKVKVVNSTDNTMSVFFWSLYPSNHRGFKLKYTSDELTVCEGDFSGLNGYIYSPENLTYYYCSWKRVDANLTSRTLALRISINADIKHLSPVPSCKYALSLSVMAGKHDMMLGQFCSNKNAIVRTPYPITEVVANQPTRTNFNFTLRYDTYPCGGIIREREGIIQSPGFPHRSSDVVECVWVIQLGQEETIKLKFDSLELGDDCAKSFVIIYNGGLNTSPRLGKYCKNTYPQTLQSQSNSLWIEYHSETSAGKGFKLSYEGISTGCGGIFHDTNKIIQTPSYPEDYPNNAECIWEVHAEQGYHIGLEFIDRFHIEKTDGCKSDFVEVWDYKSDIWSSLGRLCGRDKPGYLNSSSTQMKIMFRSNEKSSAAGFKAKWVLNCGGNFTATTNKQYIKSPGYPDKYKDNLDCWYNISAPGKHILVHFNSFELEMGSANCQYDSLTISYLVYGVVQSKSYCGKTAPPDISVKDTVSLRFKTDLFIRRSGFMFSFVTDECGQEINSPMDISSPAHVSSTDLYSKMYKCTWNITAPKDKVVAVSFDKIYTEDSHYCWYNFIALYDGRNTSAEHRMGRLCGNMTYTNPIIKSTKNQMVLQYRSYNVKENSFKASVYFSYGPAVGCGGNITLDTKNKQYIETPNLQGQIDCQWLIEAPDDYYINVEVKKLPPCLESGLNTSKHLEIRSGASPFSELIADVCNTLDTIKTFSTSGSTAFIQWSTLDNKGGNDKFKLELSSVKSECGTSTFVATETIQYISSPNYPDSYPDNMKCVWKISSTSTYRHLFLKMITFDLGSNTDGIEECTGDRLEIVDKDNRQVIDEGLGSETVYYFGRRGAEHNAKRGPLGVHQYCGQTATEFDYYSGEGNVIISFYTGSGRHGKGFKMELSAVGVCRNYTSAQGRLYSNNLTDCDFTITAPENRTISLYFLHFGISSRDSDCADSKMEIYDGGSTNATKLGTFCNFGLPDPVFSTQNILFVQIRKPLYAFAYYDITYTSTSEGRGCGGKIYNYKGRFTSPLYPANYRELSHCTWDVTVPYGLRISLKFTVFDIKASCSTDYVSVTTYRDDLAFVQTYCQTDPIVVFESMNRIKVEYYTSFNNGGAGWVAEFRAFGEDQTITW